MKLSVPFFPQISNLNCGPTALKMVAAFFGLDEGIKVFEELVGIKKGKCVLSIDLAIAAKKIGFNVDFFSTTLSLDEAHLSKPFYQNHLSIGSNDEFKLIIDHAHALRVGLYEQSMPLNEILSMVTERSVPIVLLNWNVINGKEDYVGHFVPIVGYDEENVIVHNQGMEGPTPFLKIDKALFDQARKSDGTDEDLIVISKN